MMHRSHSPPHTDLPLNDAGIALAQAIEEYCREERLPFPGIWCDCSDCGARLALVHAALPKLRGDDIATLRVVCFLYWQMFRKQAALA